MRPTDAEIWACFEKHDKLRQGHRGNREGNAAEDAAKELGLPYKAVLSVVQGRLFTGFQG